MARKPKDNSKSEDKRPLKAYKFRIYPDAAQRAMLDRTFGSTRFVWNKLVANFNKNYETGEREICTAQMIKDNPEFPWLKDCISYALQQKERDFLSTLTQFFDKSRKVPLGRMKFKKKGVCRDSFRIPAQALGYHKAVDFERGTIKIPKCGLVKCVYDRRFAGEMTNVTISRNKADQYFVSILVRQDIERLPNTNRHVGIDLGLKDLMITSDGIKFENPKFLRKNQAKIKKHQKLLSRKTKGSKRHQKQKNILAKAHLKVANQRGYLHHVVSTWLVRNYDTIILEDLNIKGMVKNHKLAGAVMDASWYSLISKIQYKCGWYGKTFHQINRFFASSKTCSCCGYKMPELALSVREWECPECKTYHDRDLNAAKNILVQGFQDLYQIDPPDERSGRGGLISLMKPVQAPAALAGLMKRELNSTNLDTIVSI